MAFDSFANSLADLNAKMAEMMESQARVSAIPVTAPVEPRIASVESRIQALEKTTKSRLDTHSEIGRARDEKIGLLETRIISLEQERGAFTQHILDLQSEARSQHAKMLLLQQEIKGLREPEAE
jgi:chromosome segregation ATPase